MSYASIGPIIEDWVHKQEIHLMYETGDPSRRYYYVSSAAGETFQIVIEPEQEGMVRIDAHLIESPTDQEAHFVWDIPKSQFENGLDLSLGSAQAWFKRK